MSEFEPSVEMHPLDAAGDGRPTRVPYLLVSQDDNPQQEVVIAGIRHFNDPADPQAAVLLDIWNRFRAGCPERSPEQTVVITEGGVFEARDDETPQDALRRDAEQGMIANLAHAANLHPVSSETTHEEQIEKLMKRYGAPATAYYYCMRMARQYISAREAGCLMDVNFYSYVM